MLRRTIVKSDFGAFLSKAKKYAFSVLARGLTEPGVVIVVFGCFLSLQLALRRTLPPDDGLFHAP
jgi:hypothetical protein